jgi:hypothetical protein
VGRLSVSPRPAHRGPISNWIVVGHSVGRLPTLLVTSGSSFYYHREPSTELMTGLA